MSYLKNELKGNIISGITTIILISMILIFILLLNTYIGINNENTQNINSDNFKYIIDDYSNNLEKISLDSIKELSSKIISSKKPSKNSQKELKEIIEKDLESKNKEYNKRYSIFINSKVIDIKSDENSPVFIKIKFEIKAIRNNEEYFDVIEKKISINGLNDPLPVLVCGNENSFSYNDTQINYGNSLENYLKNKGAENYQAYINASSPFLIRICPYDPYIHHGDNNTLKDCIEHGYYHESKDGSCYLCRLNGLTTCPHYGLETFIIGKTNYTKSVSCSDHVVFHDLYPGDKYEYYPGKYIYLDSSHRSKYGLK